MNIYINGTDEANGTSGSHKPYKSTDPVDYVKCQYCGQRLSEKKILNYGHSCPNLNAAAENGAIIKNGLVWLRAAGE